MATRAQRRQLTHLFRRRRTLGATEFQPVPSGAVWGAARRQPKPVTADPEKAARAAKALERWLKRAYPELATVILQRARERQAADQDARRRNGIGKIDWSAQLDRLTSTIQDVAPTYLQYKAQKSILDVQLDRAREGLPPLDTGEYAPTMQIGMDEATINRLATEAASRAGAGFGALARNPLTWIVGGVAAFMLLRSLGGSRAPRRRARA